ncbi:MAG: efflux RND transporter permease subunit [Myxococcales bacterium]|nr:efflux RND transporter permease subunit [Myxococcales bacterium]
MLSFIIDASLRNRVAVLMATALLVVLGLRAAARLPIDAVPDVTNVQVQVVTSAPALSPLEVEQYVSIPVERAMQGIPDVTEVRSLSKYGLSVVTVVFEDSTDIYFARQLVGERMPQVQDAVPQGYGDPQMGPISTGLGEIYQFTLRSDSMGLMELEELLDWYIGPQLRSVPGVVEVNTFGGENREYQVVLDPELLRASGLSIADVASAIEKTNANAGGGYIERDREHFVIGTDGLVTSRQDLRDVVLGATPQGAPITVASVGDVRFGPRLRRGAASMDGEGEVVAGATLMLMGENPRIVARAVREKLDALQPTFPEGTTVEAFYDRTRLVDRTIRTAVTNLAEGALLVIAVLLLLLGSLRAGLIVAAVIPLSMLFALTVMEAVGLSGNLMSLGALDFGIIVDGAVIVVENAARRLGLAARDGGPLTAARRGVIVRDATMEVRRATVYGEAIIAIVYVPILTLTGVEGKLFTPMATTVLLALAGAFILSLTLVPVLSAMFLPAAAERRPTLLMRAASAVYRPALRGALRLRALTLAVGAGVIVGAFALSAQLGAEFVPQLDEGDILVEARRLPGVALSESVRQDGRLQRALMPIPEIESVVSKTGAPEIALDPMGVEQTDVYIKLIDRARWREGLTKAALAAEIRETVERAVPEIAASLSQPIEMRTNELVAGVRSDVGLLIYGPDLDPLVELGSEALRALEGIPGVADARAEQIAGLRYLRVIPDRDKLARYGLTVADVNLATEAMAVGHEAGVVLEGDRRFSIRVLMSHEPRGDLEALASTPLRTMQGHVVPLGDVAALGFTDGPAAINREAMSRRIVVEFNVEGRDLASVVADAQRVIADALALDPGYRVEWGGTFRHYEQAKARLMWVIPIALGFIVFLLWSAFQAARPVVLILLTVPMALVGGIAALWIRDIPFSISAGVGFIALLGVAVLNGLVLVTVARVSQDEGATPHAAIEHAATLRLRPVLMTALTDVLGFVPMALSTAPGAEVQRPLATVVIGGVISATILTLVVLPAAYSLFGKRA